jgi:hypothetical protein
MRRINGTGGFEVMVSELGWAPWIGGVFVGWLACWLTDKWFVRDGAAASLAAEQRLAEAQAQIARMQSELQQREAAKPNPLAGLAGLGGLDDLDGPGGGDDTLRDIRDAVEDLNQEFQTLRQDMRYQDTSANAIRAQLERLAELIETRGER